MKQIKYRFNKLAFLISVKIEFLKVRFFYLVNKNKAINNTIKMIIVTGASKGLGRAICERLISKKNVKRKP